MTFSFSTTAALLQLNVTNVFDKRYVGGFTGGIQTPTVTASGVVTGYTAPPLVQMGATRTISGTIVVGF